MGQLLITQKLQGLDLFNGMRWSVQGRKHETAVFVFKPDSDTNGFTSFTKCLPGWWARCFSINKIAFRSLLSVETNLLSFNFECLLVKKCNNYWLLKINNDYLIKVTIYTANFVFFYSWDVLQKHLLTTKKLKILSNDKICMNILGKKWLIILHIWHQCY